MIWPDIIVIYEDSVGMGYFTAFLNEMFEVRDMVERCLVQNNVEGFSFRKGESI
jgi:hypothetical protein